MASMIQLFRDKWAQHITILDKIIASCIVALMVATGSVASSSSNSGLRGCLHQVMDWRLVLGAGELQQVLLVLCHLW